MTHIGHLFDDSTGWEQRVGVSGLLDHMPRDRYTASLAAIDPSARESLSPGGPSVEILSRLGGFGVLTAPGVARFVARERIDLVHAWGVRAAAAARALPRTPLVVQLYDPLIASREVKLLRTLARPGEFAVVCSCGTVRRRLIEGGLSPELAVVIRPGVDLSLINKYRCGSLRGELGLKRDEPVVIVPDPVTRAGGQFEAFWAVALLAYTPNAARIIVPGKTREKQRIARFAAALPAAVPPPITPGAHYPFERLLAASNVLLVTPRGDISTTSIAWAMAAGVAVVGTAVHSVAEMIANQVNGLLFKPAPGRSMAASLLKLLQDRASQQRVTEGARGQAYEIFGMRRCVEDHMRLYGNVLGGVTPGDGIIDSALTA